MADHTELDKKHLSFSQREGMVPLPDTMNLRFVSRRFRVIIWRAIYTRKMKETGNFKFHYRDYSTIDKYILAYQERIMETYFDELERSPSKQLSNLKPIITEGEYHEVLTLVEFFLRESLAAQDEPLHDALLKAFEQAPVAYFVDNAYEEPTICPRQDKISGETVAASLDDIRKGGLVGAEQHLTKAAESINEGRYSDSIVQSAQSIESVARLIAPDDCKTLGPALSSLERHNILNHRALKDAFLKLYGYTSDKEGLRHAMLEDASNPPDLDEAVFFYGACACFAAYLTKKSRQIADS